MLDYFRKYLLETGIRTSVSLPSYTVPTVTPEANIDFYRKYLGERSS